MNDEELLVRIVELMSEYSIHPQETHVDGCSYEDDDTTCDCSYSFEFKQFPKWKEDVAHLIKSHDQQIACAAISYALSELNTITYPPSGKEYQFKDGSWNNNMHSAATALAEEFIEAQNKEGK